MTGTLVQTVCRSAYDVNRDLGPEARMETHDAGTVEGMVCRIVDQGRIGLSTVC